MKEVILIGDSIRMWYEETVRKELDGLANIWSPEANGGNTRNVLANIEEWAISRQPDIVHINCGLHDICKPPGATEVAVPLKEYEANVRQILSLVKSGTKATVIWALTTPVNQEWHHENKPFDRMEANVVACNEAARRVAEELGVPVNDLFSAVEEVGRNELLKPDGVHFTDEGSVLLGKKVAEFLKPFLTDA